MIFNKFNENRLIEELKKNNIEVNKNYFLVNRIRSFKKALAQLLIWNLYFTIEGASLYLVVFTADNIFVSKVSGELLGFKERDFLEFTKIPMNQIENFTIKKHFTKVVVSWEYQDEKMAFEISYKFPGIYRFNKENCEYLLEKNFNKK